LGRCKGITSAANAGIWEASSTGNEIEWTPTGPVVKELDTTYLSEKPGIQNYDIAIELAFTKHFTDKWVAEARVYKGFVVVNTNASSSYTERMKQLTLRLH
jgi:hypothetical protein